MIRILVEEHPLRHPLILQIRTRATKLKNVMRIGHTVAVADVRGAVQNSPVVFSCSADEQAVCTFDKIT